MAKIRRLFPTPPWLTVWTAGFTACAGLSVAAPSSNEPAPNFYTVPSSTSESSRQESSSRDSRTARRSSRSSKRAHAAASARNASHAAAEYTQMAALNYYSQPTQTQAQSGYQTQAQPAARPTTQPNYYSQQTRFSSGQNLRNAEQPVQYSSVSYVPSQPQQMPAQESRGAAQGQTSQRGMLSRLFSRSDEPKKEAPVASVAPSKFSGTEQTGAASWYGSDFHGGKTANGERYDMHSMTAAHRTLPFGTVCKVTNLHNGKECVVRINNRGPYLRGRIIDMSKGAAAKLGFVGRGVAKVKMQVLGKAPK